MGVKAEDFTFLIFLEGPKNLLRTYTPNPCLGFWVTPLSLIPQPSCASREKARQAFVGARPTSRPCRAGVAQGK